MNTALKPGSPDAIRLGCLCPVVDNHHGAGVPAPNGPMFWMSADCPLHGHAAHEPDVLPPIREQEIEE